jgi:hypothetical protein
MFRQNMHAHPLVFLHFRDVMPSVKVHMTHRVQRGHWFGRCQEQPCHEGEHQESLCPACRKPVESVCRDGGSHLPRDGVAPEKTSPSCISIFLGPMESIAAIKHGGQGRCPGRCDPQWRQFCSDGNRPSPLRPMVSWDIWHCISVIYRQSVAFIYLFEASKEAELLDPNLVAFSFLLTRQCPSISYVYAYVRFF